MKHLEKKSAHTAKLPTGRVRITGFFRRHADAPASGESQGEVDFFPSCFILFHFVASREVSDATCAHFGRGGSDEPGLPRSG